MITNSLFIIYFLCPMDDDGQNLGRIKKINVYTRIILALDGYFITHK